MFKRNDDYLAQGEPSCEWDDKEAREILVDALAQDAYAALAAMEEHQVDANVGQAIELLATVVGQDIDKNKAGLFSKSDFDIDLERQTVRCPQRIMVPLKSLVALCHREPQAARQTRPAPPR
ncbi:MAG: hypothetical protein GY811_03575 [Myxococcales bacterium]|nr:hypothetical protein [Myxococcales bacterium]